MTTRRRSINIAGFRHSNPIPNASIVGSLLMSGVIVGRDPGAKTIPEDLDGQLANMFAHVDEIMRTAGGSPDDIIKMTVWLTDTGDRELLNKRWLEMFPDPDARPTRHVLPLQVRSDALVQCDITAVLEEA